MPRMQSPSVSVNSVGFFRTGVVMIWTMYEPVPRFEKSYKINFHSLFNSFHRPPSRPRPQILSRRRRREESLKEAQNPKRSANLSRIKFNSLEERVPSLR